MTKRILIFTGGRLGSWALETIRQDDYLIGADRGALFLTSHGYTPDIAVGDFDSVSEQEMQLIERLSRHTIGCDPILKDLTDTEMAFELAIKQNPQQIVFIGALGSRFDHSLANVHLLLRCLKLNIEASILDENNEITLIDRSAIVKQSRFHQVSLLPLTSEVTGITLRGFQYPLRDASLSIGQSLGVSNVLVDPVGEITIRSGLLLIIRSMD